MPPTTSEPLQRFGMSLKQLILDLPDCDAITDTLNYLLGALYGLCRAQELGFHDRPARQIQFYSAFLANDAHRIAHGQLPDEPWLAGFYFNSAIQRLAAAFDRIPKLLRAKKKVEKLVDGATTGEKRDTTVKEKMADVNPDEFAQWQHLYDEVNDFKHEPGGRAAGRGVTLADAVDAFEQALALLSKGANNLKAWYP